MAGGIYIGQKVRPGAYINFKAVTTKEASLGTRGVATVPIELDWGGDGMIDVLSTDLVDGNSLVKLGLTAFDTTDSAQIAREVLRYCPRCYFYRINSTAAAKATATQGAFTVTAKYGGTFGNRISFGVIAIDSGAYDLVTYVDGGERDRQRITAASEAKNNGWVDFEATEAPLAPIAGAALAGGTNGTVATADFTNYFGVAENYVWNTMGLPTSDAAVTLQARTFAKKMREEKGFKVQVVCYDYSDADYEGIISVDQGYKTATEEVSAINFTATMAGITAGSAVNQSNTYRVIENAVDIVPAKADAEIESGLSQGKLMLSRRIDGAIVIEKDINTLVSFGADKNYDFTKNRVVRTLDDIAMWVLTNFSVSYIGKVDSNTDGLNLLRGDIIGYMTLLQSINAIKNFDSTGDIEVVAGNDQESVIARLAIQPVDSMEKLYMDVTVLTGGIS